MAPESERWPERGLRIEIWEEDLAAFFACLCLGMLHAMRARVIPAEVGIWALGPPWAARLRGRVPDGIHDVVYETDEIDAMAGLGTPEELDAMLDEMIRRVEAELSDIEEPLWTIHPVSPAGTTSPWPVDLADITEGDGKESEEQDGENGGEAVH